MKRKHLPQYESLVHLVNGAASGNNLDARARRGSYWRNTVKVQVKDGTGSGLLLTHDGYFVTNYHVLSDERTRDSCAVIIPDIDYQYPVLRILQKSRLHDLVLAKAAVTSSQEPTEIIFTDDKPSLTDRVRTYGYKHEVIEERQGSICIGDPSVFRKEFWQDIGVHTVNPELEKIAIQNTFYSTCDVEHGWSGGPVVLEKSGELLGFTRFMTNSSDPLTWAKLIPEKHHGFTYAHKLRHLINSFLEKEE